MRRCKLISPTNLMLEHPILSPVEECEYFLLGVKEYKKKTRELVIGGVLCGAFGALMLALVIKGMVILWH